MSVPITHPDAAQLEAFNQGRLDDEAVWTAIACHLDTCAECRTTLEGFSCDPLEDLVRSAVSSLAEKECVEPIPEQLEYFRIERVLGQGGMGTIYLADDTRLHRKVALKTLKRALAEKPQARDRFLREARAGAALEHDHIVPIYYVGEADGTPFLAMPLLKGMSLDTYLQQAGGYLAPARCVAIARQIAMGLAAAHERGLIHRDIKPTNIWLEPNAGRSTGSFRVKILDFGLAQHEGDDSQLTQSGYILGTPAYMSPEQARGEKVDARSDLWSLGVILYVMTTGTRPFLGPTTMGVLTSIAVDHPTPPATLNPHCSPALSSLVTRLLEKDPAKRPGSAEAVIEALAKLEREPDAPTSCDEVILSAPSQENSQEACSRTDATVSFGAPSVGIEEADPSTLQCLSKQAQAHTTHPAPHKPRRRVAVATALVLLSLTWLFGGTIYRIATNQGQLVVEIHDNDVEVRIVQEGVVVQQKTSRREFILAARRGEIEVLEKNGIKLTTKKFELTRNGKTTVTVSPEELTEARKPAPLFVGDPDRRAAEYAVSISGIIRINGEPREIRSASELPKEQFRLTSLSFLNNQQVTEAGLANFSGCHHLSEIDLSAAPVTDVGMAHFKDCKNLTKLLVTSPAVTDAGLAHVKDCKHLTHLYLGGTAVTDTGIAWFKDCKLTLLYLGTTAVTDAGLAPLRAART